jgi:acyl carrier protein
MQMLPAEDALTAAGPIAEGSRKVRDLLKSGGELESYVQRVFAEQSGLPVSRIEAGMPLVNIGLDSLGTSLVKNRLEQEFGVDLSFGQLFGQGTVRDLAAYLQTSLSEALARPARRDPMGAACRPRVGKWGGIRFPAVKSDYGSWSKCSLAAR